MPSDPKCKVSAPRRHGRWLLITVGAAVHSFHREWPSTGFLVYPDEATAISAELDATNGKKTLGRISEQAVAAMFDPDLSLGDYGVDLHGDLAQIPDAFLGDGERVSGTVPTFPDTGAMTLPRSFTPGVLAWIASGKQDYDPTPAEDAPLDRFLLLRGATPIAIVESGNLRWQTAARRVVQQGEIPMADDLVDLSHGEPFNLLTRKLPAALPHGIPTVRAKGAYFGPRLTPHSLRLDIMGQLRLLGLNEEIPKLEADALSMRNQLRAKTDLLQADRTQMAYVKRIASLLALDVSTDIMTIGEARSFIGEHRAAYRLAKYGPEEDTW